MSKILLIDDNTSVLDGLESIIDAYFSTQLTVTLCSNGYDALQLLKKDYFPLIISDNKMPNLSGLQLLEILQNHHIPSTVIILSGYDDYKYIRAALKIGAYDYLLKPVNIPSLVSMIQTLLPALEINEVLLPPNLSEQFTVKSPTSYFDIIAVDPCLTEQELLSQLDDISTMILNLDSSGVFHKIDDLFQHISEESLTEEILKKGLTQFIYSLISKNDSFIKIIAEFKLTEYDILSQIKNLQSLSQLRERIQDTIHIYIDRLRQVKDTNEDYIIQKSSRYIDEHCCDNLTLPELASQFHLHPNYFSFLFKRKYGITVRDYILKTRIEKAKQMMNDRCFRLIDIALACGYQDASHFNRAFKKVTGISPSQYRSINFHDE